MREQRPQLVRQWNKCVKLLSLVGYVREHSLIPLYTSYQATKWRLSSDGQKLTNKLLTISLTIFS